MASTCQCERILPLLALAGVGVGVIIATSLPLSRKRNTVDGLDSFIEDHSCPKENYITRLPDDILCHIISYLNMKDAVRTSVLSRRWRKVYCTLRNPKFECPEMRSVTLTGHKNWHYDCKQRLVTGVHRMFDFLSPFKHNCRRERFVTVVDTFLRLRSGSGLTMESFTLRFGLMREFPRHLRSWMNCIVRSGVRNLNLNFCCNDKLLKIPDSELTLLPFEVLLNASSMLEYVKLSYCILEPNFQGLSNSLKKLSLWFVPLVNGEIERILSSCPQLRLLDLMYCKLPYKLVVNALELRSLKIRCCEQVRAIGFSAPNLDVLFYMGNFGISFFPSYVPNLRELFVDVMHNNGPPQGFVGFVQGAPSLYTLWFQAPPYQVRHLQKEMPTIRNLHGLSLYVMRESLDLRDIISVAAILPNLSMFEFSCHQCLLSYTETDAEVPLTCVNLKLVWIDGFKFDAPQKKFVSQLLRCAPALEVMKIYTAYYMYGLGRDLEKTLPLKRRVFPHELISRTKQQLERQASSPLAVVDISLDKQISNH